MTPADRCRAEIAAIDALENYDGPAYLPAMGASDWRVELDLLDGKLPVIGAVDEYQEYLAGKRFTAAPVGFDPGPLHPSMFPYQLAVTSWGLRKGRAAFFQDCGLGKTFEQIEWAREIHRHTGRAVLILSPLAVAEQTIAEAARFLPRH